MDTVSREGELTHDQELATTQPAGAAADLPPALRALVQRVFRLYSTKSPEELVAGLEVYAEGARFLHPLVYAKGRRELALQFYSLQRVFSHVTVEQNEADIQLVELSGGKLLVSVSSTQHLQFSRTNGISQRTLDEEAKLEVRTRLTVDSARQQVVRHEDEWAGVPGLPLAWRRLNCHWTNTLYRMLGWNAVLDRAWKQAHLAS